jgi:SPP1 family predicted phage head-tail adaptor
MYNKGENIGKLNKRVTIEEYTTARDDYNAEVRTWTTSGPYWAGIEYTTARSDEEAIAQRIASRVYALVTMRYRSSIRPEMKLVHDNERFNILTILPDNKKQYMRLECVLDEPRS